MLQLIFERTFLETCSREIEDNSEILSDFFISFINDFRGKVQVLVDFQFDELVLKEKLSTDRLFYAISSISAKTKYEQLTEDYFELYEKTYFSSVLFSNNTNLNKLSTNNSFTVLSTERLKEYWVILRPNIAKQDFLIRSGNQNEEDGYFPGWNFFERFSRFTSKAILVDGYVLGDKTNQKIQNNLLPFLESLFGKDTKYRKELLIFTKELPGKIKKEEKDYWFKNDFKNLKPLLTWVWNSCSIKFIRYSEAANKGDSIHNRFLISNLFLIENRAGFNFYKSNANVNNADILTVKSIFSTYNYRLWLDHLDQCQEYMEGLKETEEVIMAGPRKEICFNIYSNDFFN
jgi:hypothetical protein